MNTVQHDLAHQAYAKGLISKVMHRTVADARNHLTVDERTDLFMEELESKIRIEATALVKFVDVLRESDSVYYAILIQLISKLCTCKLHMYIASTE